MEGWARRALLRRVILSLSRIEAEIGFLYIFQLVHYNFQQGLMGRVGPGFFQFVFSLPPGSCSAEGGERPVQARTQRWAWSKLAGADQRRKLGLGVHTVRAWRCC